MGRSSGTMPPEPCSKLCTQVGHFLAAELSAKAAVTRVLGKAAMQRELQVIYTR
jgi:hypothetical protein